MSKTKTITATGDVMQVPFLFDRSQTVAELVEQLPTVQGENGERYFLQSLTIPTLKTIDRAGVLSSVFPRATYWSEERIAAELAEDERLFGTGV